MLLQRVSMGVTTNLGYEFTFNAIDHQKITIKIGDGLKKWKTNSKRF
jgi:hypothetical protein